MASLSLIFADETSMATHDCRNYTELWEHAADGTVTHFAWVTDLPIHNVNLMTLNARCSRTLEDRERDLQYP